MAIDSAARTATQQLVAWLDDAHAMERGLIPILRNQVAHFERMPHVASRLLEHIEETGTHAERMRRCLLILNANPSTAKSAMSSVMGTIEGASTAMFADEVVKDALADYGAEQFEVGCYTALIGTALRLGYPEIAELCAQNLEEDQAMADWILEELPAIVEHHATS
jgi:ferritin-like metal-binding protein YciE